MRARNVVACHVAEEKRVRIRLLVQHCNVVAYNVAQESVREWGYKFNIAVWVSLFSAQEFAHKKLSL